LPENPAVFDVATGARLVEGQDYYYDGPYVVFTSQYHLKRGECCGSNCRHCPWGMAAGPHL